MNSRIVISRRTATRSMLGTCAGALTLDFRSRLDAAEWPEFSFLIVTDTHIGYKEKTGAEKQWEKTAPEVAKAEGDFVLHLGDIVDNGRESQYPIYKKIRETIRKPVYEIPGNHDPIDLFEKHVNETSDRSFDHEGVRFVLFNNAQRESHDGFVTEEQLKWIGEQFGEAAEKNLRIIVCAHVPFHSNRHPDRGWYVKPENGQTVFYKLVEEHRDRVLAMFHGHFHNGIRGWETRSPVHEVLMPSALYNLDRGLEEKGAEGYNLEEFRPGFVKAKFGDGQLRLRYQPTGADASVVKDLSF